MDSKTFKLTALSPLDGRYADKVASLAEIFSEQGLIRRRVAVELAWFEELCEVPAIKELPALKKSERQQVRRIAETFDLASARRVKVLESKTNHDVKAVEYYLKEQFAQTALADRAEFLHFACTSEDINNVSYALMLRDGLAILRAAQKKLEAKLRALASAFADDAMLAHTHGQPATPTTLGKELAVFAARLSHQGEALDAMKMRAKMNGAVGCYNAHMVAYPQVDWQKVARQVIEKRLGLQLNAYTTQIEPHDGIAELCDALARWNTVLLDLDRDIWNYISLGYLGQQTVKGEVGSSTMPHKVNPIDFENSEGNLGVANALLGHFAGKLPVSRMQRDLSDSTVLRNLGVAFGYSLVAVESTLKGLGKISVNRPRLAEELEANWEVLAEPIQTVMRKLGLPHPYERLKELTRGKKVGQEEIRAFIRSLKLPPAEERRLLALTPATYTGLAPKLARGR